MFIYGLQLSRVDLQYFVQVAGERNNEALKNTIIFLFSKQLPWLPTDHYYQNLLLSISSKFYCSSERTTALAAKVNRRQLFRKYFVLDFNLFVVVVLKNKQKTTTTQFATYTSMMPPSFTRYIKNLDQIAKPLVLK